MNKADLVASVAKQTGLTKKDSEAAVKAVLESIEKSLKKGEKVQLIGFGTFDVRARAAKEARNPRTGETIKVAAHKVPAIKAGQALKDAVK